jgi:hypothetical protein
MSILQEEKQITSRHNRWLRKHDAPTEPIEPSTMDHPSQTPRARIEFENRYGTASEPHAGGRAHQIGAARARTWGWEARPSAWSENPVGLAAAGGEPAPAAGGAAPYSAWAWAPASPGAGPPLPS